MEKELQYNRYTTIDQRIADVRSKIEKFNSRLQRLEEVRAIWDQLKFKEGDAAYHPKFKNVLIKSIEYGNTEEAIDEIYYHVVTVKDGNQKVSFRDIVAINDTSKVIYGES